LLQAVDNARMQIYAVGGCVRDELLGLPVQDHDWVVVGATPQQLMDAGYLPVGKDFPVFLHPQTKEEYALARTERKTAAGYHGFTFHADASVTLEEDLARRDFTVNAMAKTQDGGLIDPFGGRADLAAKVFRHVGPAFSEDPVRILRLARFMARFTEFSVADETMALARGMVVAGEVDALVPERVWQELARGLMAAKPSRMFDVLRECGALEKLLPELDALWGVPQREEYHPEIDTGIHNMMVIDMAARMNLPLAARFACLTHDLGKGTTPAELLPKHIGHEARSVELIDHVCDRLRVPTDCKELALVVAAEHGNIHRSMGFDAAALTRLIERCDAIRKPARFKEILQACEADARGRLGLQDKAYPQAARLLAAAQAARDVDAGAVAARYEGKPQQIKQAVHQARIEAVAAAISARDSLEP
jgi:tRNA nucleotidyltransferase (CCA-adding enzyme)